MKLNIMELFITVGLISFANAQDKIDENEMFADTASVVNNIVDNPKDNASSKEVKSVGVSGEITSVLIGSSERGLLSDPSFDRTSMSTYVEGNLLLDVRLLQGFKALGNMEVSYNADSSAPDISLRELFLDANIGHKIYLRAGKQLLQWGRCYLWNPTDLINVEKKSFIQKIGYREGTFGLKAHIPYGTTANFYGFIDARNAVRIDSMACAAKAEILLHNTEVAFSIWDKRGKKPVYGVDISTDLFKINFNGELALYQTYKASLVNKNWVPRIAVNATKSFDAFDVTDRISVTMEFYYNSVGDNSKRINFEKILTTLGNQSLISDSLPNNEQNGSLMMSGIYEPNNFSKYYGALFISVNKFILNDMALSCNAILNLNQMCTTISTGLTYSLLNDFSIGLQAINYVGPSNTEYTLSGRNFDLQLTAGVAF
jgi:hypothetical protein